MFVYLPVAEMSVNALEIIFLGGVVGFFSGLFGVGGGFLSLPFLVFAGIPPTIAVTTQSCQIIASSGAATLSQFRRKRVDVPLALHMMAGGFAGVILGLGIFGLLEMLGQIDFAISATYALLLACIGLSMLGELVRSFLARRRGTTAPPNRIAAWLKTLPYQRDYVTSGIRVSVFGPVGIGFIGGLMISILGSGGSFMLVPAMIYLLGMPALFVTGTSLFQLLVLATASCLLHAATTQSIDLVLAALLVGGSVVGAILGLRAAKHIKGAWAHLLLATLILAVAARMGYDLLVTPDEAFSMVMGH